MHNRITPEIAYNNLLPRLHEGLRKRGIVYVDLYSEFNQSKDNLYYRTDTHWNDKGVALTVNKILELFTGFNGLKEQ